MDHQDAFTRLANAARKANQEDDPKGTDEKEVYRPSRSKSGSKANFSIVVLALLSTSLEACREKGWGK